MNHIDFERREWPSRFARRRACQRLGVGIADIYSTPVVITIFDAHATTGSSGSADDISTSVSSPTRSSRYSA